MDISALCTEYHVYFIRGYNTNVLPISGARTKENDNLLLETVQGIFGVDNDHFHVIGNNSSLPTTNVQVKDRIKRVVTRRLVECGCGRITTVLLCHSLGTRFTYFALKELYDLQIVSAQVYRRTAIISLGGIELIPKSFAKITLNYMYENDTVVNSFISKQQKAREEYETVTIGPFKRKSESDYTCKCCISYLGQSDSESYTLGGMIKTIAPYAIGAGALAAAPVSIPVAAAVGATALFTGGVIKRTLKCEAHYMTDYLLCRTWKEQIRDRLTLWAHNLP